MAVENDFHAFRVHRPRRAPLGRAAGGGFLPAVADERSVGGGEAELSEEEEEEEKDGARTPPGAPPPPAEEWMAAYPAEYRTQPGLTAWTAWTTGTGRAGGERDISTRRVGARAAARCGGTKVGARQRWRRERECRLGEWPTRSYSFTLIPRTSAAFYSARPVHPPTKSHRPRSLDAQTPTRPHPHPHARARNTFRSSRAKK